MREITVAGLRKQCEQAWGDVKAVAVSLSYLRSASATEAHDQSPADMLECQMLCRGFVKRFKERTAPYEAIPILVAAEGDAEGEYGFVLFLKSPAGIEPLILTKIIRDCWDHCFERITSFSVDDIDAGFAAELSLSTRESP
jgi:hypothetical protein